MYSGSVKEPEIFGGLAPLPKSIPVRAADQTEEGLKVMEAERDMF